MSEEMDRDMRDVIGEKINWGCAQVLESQNGHSLVNKDFALPPFQFACSTWGSKFLKAELCGIYLYLMLC